MRRQHGCGSGLSLLVSLVVLAHSHGVTQADDVEQRDFAITVNGRDAGHSRLTITVQKDGTTVVAASAQVKVTQLLISYTYNVDATEWWKDGKLVGLKASSTENGKRMEVLAAIDANRLKVRVNGQEHLAAPDVWTSSFWKLADSRYHNKTVPVLDPDTGDEFNGQLQYIGSEQITVVSEAQTCFHFRLSGGEAPIDLWFDRYHRLVRQEFTELGHKTVVRMTSLKR